MFDVASGSGTVGGVELSRENVTNPSEGAPENLVTSGGFSSLEDIAQRQADGSFVDSCLDGEGEGMVRIPPVEEMFCKRLRRRKERSITLISRRRVCKKSISN